MAPTSSSSSSCRTLRPSKVQIGTLQPPVSQGTEDYNGDANEYILQCVHACDGSTVAASLSSHQIKIYDRRTLEPVSARALEGHTGAITSLFFSPVHPALLASSSEDQTVRLWDTRTAQAQACVGVIKQDGEALSCALGPNTGLLAVGVEEHVNFFDVRKPAASSDEKSRLGQYANAHTDLVTKVLFHPTQPTTLASGSEDGLVCLYNTGVGQTDEAVVCILNAECPVRDLTFFGTQGDGMAVLTGSEGTSVWHWPSAQRMVQLDDLRYAAGEALGIGKASKRQEGQVALPLSSLPPPPPPSVFSVQYHYDGGEGRDRLLLAVSDVQGQIAMLQMQPTGHMVPVFQLQGGHQALVRAVDFDFGSSTIVTAGEDARLCLWSTTGEGGVDNRSSASPSSSATPPHHQQHHKKQNAHKAKLKKGLAHYHPY